MLARVANGTARLFTRNGHDWSQRMPKVCAALEALPIDEVWLDGEAVVLDSAGIPDFNALQNSFDSRSTSKIVLFFFDLMYVNGTDVREQPLKARRALLSELMDEVNTDLLRYSEDFAQDPGSLVASACKMKLEGIIGKRADAPYRSGRSTDWIKLKCLLRQEFVLGGFTRVRGAKGEIRHPIFHGMRDDKPAAAVTEEPMVDVENGEPVEAETGSTRVQPGRRGNVTLRGQKISNAERVIDPVTGLKKIDLVRYYDEIAEWALPYLQDRPVSLVRAPNGIQGAFLSEARRKNAHPRYHEAFHRAIPEASAIARRRRPRGARRLGAVECRRVAHMERCAAPSGAS
jgi:hypothetical protein